MKRASFGRSLAFAVFAGLMSFPCLLLGARIFGHDASLALLLLTLVPLSLASCAPSLRTALAGAFVSGLCGTLTCGLLLWSPQLGLALLGAIASLGLGRAIAYPKRALARTLVLELGLGVSSAAAFAAFSDGRLMGDSFAVWSFWLMQSAFAVVARPAPAAEIPVGDRFEHAAAKAYRLMRL